MGIDSLFTNGVIAVKEKDLLKDKIFRFCELGAEKAFHALLESGFGGGAEVTEGVEPLVAKEEELLDGFIREYAPSKAEAEYLLAPRDFHNAKAILKAEYLHSDASKMLCPEGLIPVSQISMRIREGNYAALGVALGGALEEAAALLKSEETSVSGAEIGGIFERALFAHLKFVCKGNRTLKKMIVQKADMTNLLTAFRAPDPEYAATLFVPGGSLKKEELAKLFPPDERAERAFESSPYALFCRSCFEAKREGKPFTEGERKLASFETEYFAARKYELQKDQPFLYYVFRRRAEIENVRMVFVCLAAGMKEQDVKNRLRAV